MDTSLDFGMYLPSARTGAATLERARIAEQIGLSTVWIPDLIDPGVFECMTLSSAVATATSRIRVGLGVVNLMLRSPPLLIRTLASLDQLSAGRLMIGIGVGVDFCFEEYGLSAAPYSRRVDQLRETLEAMNLHFTQDTVSFAGQWVQLAEAKTAPRPVQSPPPVLIGGGSKKMLQLAARHANLWEVGRWRNYRRYESESKLSVLTRKRTELDEACERIDRDPADIETVSDFWFTMADSVEEASIAAERAKSWADHYELHGGTPERIAEELSEYAQAGVRHVILSFLNYARGETPKLFKERVMPLFE